MLLIGVLLGLGLGGSFRNLADVQIRFWPAIPVAVLLQVVPLPALGGRPGQVVPVGMLLASLVILFLVAVANWRLYGFVVIAVGVLMNFVVIGANHGMPVSRDAVLAAGGADRIDELPREPGSRHHLASGEDSLMFLGDVIGIRPPFGVVVSVGDLLTYGGATAFVVAAMLGRPVRRRPPEREPHHRPHPWSGPPAATTRSETQP
jgi:Family of unknown function (DUF5317)